MRFAIAIPTDAASWRVVRRAISFYGRGVHECAWAMHTDVDYSTTNLRR